MWKPKEKELSIEDAIVQAKEELAPYWFGSLPLLAGISQDDQVLVVSLNEKLNQGNWLLFFVDPTEFSGELMIHYAKEWYKRYHAYRLEILLIISPCYSYLKVKETIQAMLEENQIRFPVVLDMDQLIARAFGISKNPHLVGLKLGKKFVECANEDSIVSFEADLQHFLRSSDPGLALWPGYIPSQAILQNNKKIEFGYLPEYAPWKPKIFADFTQVNENLRLFKFQNNQLHPPQEEEIFIYGEWIQGPDKISTSDQHAYIVLSCNSAYFSIIAESNSKTTEIPKVVIEIDGLAAHEQIAGKNLIFDDSGQSIIKITKPRLYHIFAGLPDKQQQITLKFTNADFANLSLYGVRFGKLFSNFSTQS